MKSRAFFGWLVALGCLQAAPAFAQGDGDIAMREQAGREADWANYMNRLRRGDRVPMDHRIRGYVVDDWRAHRLPRPPAGHQWVQAGADYLLVEHRTGIVRDRLRGP